MSSRRRRRVPTRRWATSCGCGRDSATRGGRATSTTPPRRSSRATVVTSPTMLARPARPARRRPVHRPGRARVRLRARRRRRRDEHRPPARPRRRRAADGEARPSDRRRPGPGGEGWEWNQVLMDLGATVCRPAPRCAECPVAGSCAWHRAGHPDPDPAVGSAGVSTTQPPYDGSARQARGRVLHALANGAAPADDFPAGDRRRPRRRPPRRARARTPASACR